MVNNDLKQFRDQLATWIDMRMESGQLPFRRLEKNLPVVTRSARLSADIILWINRNSLIAGSLLLLPKHVDKNILEEGSALAEALGLGHFVTWGAREISIWKASGGEVDVLEKLQVPASDRIKPRDFSVLLDDLLTRLKMVTVTTARPASELPPLYYLNLCLCTLQDLMPDIIDRVKLVAGEDQSDSWVAHKPTETAWLSLLRVLYLIWQKKLPPGLQPDRLEQAMQYALSDLEHPPLSLLRNHEDETLLGNKVAVRLNHLAGRLKQLDWPARSEQAEDLFTLLLTECAEQLNLSSPESPWPLPQPDVLVNCWPGRKTKSRIMVAPEPFLAVVALAKTAAQEECPGALIDDVSRLPVITDASTVMAQFHEELPPGKNDRQRRLVALRQAWPNRRFDLHRKTPLSIWQAVHLLGVQNPPADLTVILPADWHIKPGSEVFWSCAGERYQLLDSHEQDGKHSLHFGRETVDNPVTRFHRQEGILSIAHDALREQSPGLICLYQRTSPEVIKLLRENRLIAPGLAAPDWAKGLNGGTWLFLHSRLGQYLWTIVSSHAPLPERDKVLEACCRRGLPLPARTILEVFEQLDLQRETSLPSQDKLDRLVEKMFGLKAGNLLISTTAGRSDQTQKTATKVPAEEIIEEVFRDGIPRFPEHYLIRYYRPRLIHFDVPGPLVLTDSFFDRVLLLGPQQEDVEVSGKALAEALLLATSSGPAVIDLPADESICEDINKAYCDDLKKHWEVLIRQCRSHSPERQAALKLARKIWRDLKLPPVDLFERLG